MDPKSRRPETHLPLTFEATLVDDSVRPFDPDRIELSITNTADERIGVSSGAPGPFGVLRAESSSGDDQVTLWSDAYDESDHVHTTGRRVQAVNDIGIVTELVPGETQTQTYEIGRWRLPRACMRSTDRLVSSSTRSTTRETGGSRVRRFHTSCASRSGEPPSTGVRKRTAVNRYAVIHDRERSIPSARRRRTVPPHHARGRRAARLLDGRPRDACVRRAIHRLDQRRLLDVRRPRGVALIVDPLGTVHGNRVGLPTVRRAFRIETLLSPSVLHALRRS